MERQYFTITMHSRGQKVLITNSIKNKEMICTVKHVLLIVIMAVFCSCGSRTSKSSENVRKNVPATKYRRYATEDSAIALDVSMLPGAMWDDGTLFYVQSRRYYNLSDKEIETIKTILSDKQKWQKVRSKFPTLNLSVYYRQYLAYRKQGHLYVLVNLYKMQQNGKNGGQLRVLRPSTFCHLLWFCISL